MSTFEAALKEPYLSLEEERDAIRSWQENGDRNALGLLMRSHARQAWSHARKWTNNMTDLEDLVGEGMMALLEAANNFDLERNVRFSTYANWFVKNRIFAALTKFRTAIDVPTRVYLDARAGRLTPERSAEAIAAVDNLVPVSGGVSDDHENSTVLPCPNKNPEEFVSEQSSKDQMTQLLETALQNLDPIEETIIRRRLDEDTHDDASVAATLKVTRTQMRSIERRAMHRLRQMLQERGFGFAMLDH